MQIDIVDVFAEARYQGNQLAVVRNASALDSTAMQAIAREMNFSETTFVVAHETGVDDPSAVAATNRTPRDHAAVRIFTPAEELPFAGHPTLGTAWVLTDGGRRDIVLQLAAGDVAVRFADGLAWMTPPEASFGRVLPTADAAALIGLAEHDLDATLPPRLLRCGPEFPMIAVRDLQTLKRIRVDAESSQALGIPGFPFAFCQGGYSADADFAARMLFFDGVGLREDPATGSANAALAALLRAHGRQGRLVVEQGFEIERPSRIYLDVGATLQVGGRVSGVVRGQLL